MTKAEKIEAFDPNGVGLRNDKFIGLPFDEADAEVVLLPVPWDTTVSYKAGTAYAPGRILEASTQLDLYDEHVPDAWKIGIYMRPADDQLLQLNAEMRQKSEDYISLLERGLSPTENDQTLLDQLNEINRAAEQVHENVYHQSLELLRADKIVGVVGGEHSVPFGLLRALSEQYTDGFGVLQLDAHMDLREAYEGFIYSHASIFYNSLSLDGLRKLVQVGIRDYCEAEADLAKRDDRITVYTNSSIQSRMMEGTAFREIVADIVAQLPERVYISFDIDALESTYCPGTGTPVPGGLTYDQALYLIRAVTDAGKIIIGFDLSEVGNAEYDANVGARILYQLSNQAAKSQGRMP